MVESGLKWSEYLVESSTNCKNLGRKEVFEKIAFYCFPMVLAFTFSGGFVPISLERSLYVKSWRKQTQILFSSILYIDGSSPNSKCAFLDIFWRKIHSKTLTLYRNDHRLSLTAFLCWLCWKLTFAMKSEVGEWGHSPADSRRPPKRTLHSWLSGSLVLNITIANENKRHIWVWRTSVEKKVLRLKI